LATQGKEKNLKISIIGAGRLGTAMGYAITVKKSKEIKVISMAAPSKKDLNKAKKILGKNAENILFTTDNNAAAADADVIFICTPDDNIREACRGLYKGDKRNGKTVIHFSGSKPLTVLNDAFKKRDHIASMHPLKSFATTPDAAGSLKGIEYGITYTNREGENAVKKIVSLLEGKSVFVKDEEKPAYHAAACIASNYLVTLIEYAVSINEKIGIKTAASTAGLLELMEGTIGNIKKLGIKESLTGPIARGDTGTVRKHLEKLDGILDEEDIKLYKIMGSKTSDLARQNGWIDDITYKKFKKLLDTDK